MSTEWIVGIVFGLILLVSFMVSIPVMYRYVRAKDEELRNSGMSQGDLNETKTFSEMVMEFNLQTSVFMLPSLYIATFLYARNKRGSR